MRNSVKNQNLFFEMQKNQNDFFGPKSFLYKE